MPLLKEPRYIDATEVAKMVRAELKLAWPDVKFRVRTDRYAGGCAIDIHYVDGPTQRQVERLVRRFEGAEFDGMRDQMNYKTGEIEGEPVRFGVDFIMAYRTIAPATRERLVAELEKVTGQPYKATTPYAFKYKGKEIEGYGDQIVWQMACLEDLCEWTT